MGNLTSHTSQNLPPPVRLPLEAETPARSWVDENLAAILAFPPGTSLHLQDVSWEEYQHLLDGLDERPRFKMTYNFGDLHIMTKTFRHESFASLFTPLILVLCEELDIEMIGGGTTTLSSENTLSGAEGDDCFYFDHLEEIGEKDRLDLTVDPPPNILVEVDVTNPSIKKLPTYATLGIPEIWHFDGTVVTFHQLSESGYAEATHSLRFPFLSADVMPTFLLIGKKEGTMKMMKAFRAWVKTHQQ